MISFPYFTRSFPFLLSQGLALAFAFIHFIVELCRLRCYYAVNGEFRHSLEFSVLAFYIFACVWHHPPFHVINLICSSAIIIYIYTNMRVHCAKKRRAIRGTHWSLEYYHIGRQSYEMHIVYWSVRASVQYEYSTNRIESNQINWRHA